MSSTTGRPNQRHRTRKDLLAAAARMIRAGQSPSMDDVAREAMVSRATAYRYFDNIEALLIEAPLDRAVPTPEDVFAEDRSTDPIQRVDKAESAMHDACYRNEAQLRRMLVASIQRQLNEPGDVPVRQNRRSAMIEAALAPSRSRFTRANYDKLCAALAMVFGTESMIVFNDVLRVDEKTARRVKSWAVRSLVNAAMQESASK